MRSSRRCAFLLALGVVAGISGCTDDTARGVGPSASPSRWTSPEALDESLLTVGHDELSCAGDHVMGDVSEDLLAIRPGGARDHPPNPATPESIVDAFVRGRVPSMIKGWDPARPPARTITRGVHEGNRQARADFRNPDGAVIAVVVMSWVRGFGWHFDGDRYCAYGPDEFRTPAATLDPTVLIQGDLFKRAQVQREAVKLDCPGGPLMSVTADRVAVVGADRRRDPDAQPLTNPDPATDGLAAAAAEWARNQTHAANPGWDDAGPPVAVYLFPGVPAESWRAIVRFETASGGAVAAYVAERDTRRGPWFVETSWQCSW